MDLRHFYTNKLLDFDDSARPVTPGAVFQLGGKMYLVHRIEQIAVEDITPSGGCTGASGPAQTRTFEPSAAEMAIAGGKKEVEGYAASFAIRDKLKVQEAELRASMEGKFEIFALEARISDLERQVREMREAPAPQIPSNMEAYT
jgi:hypothetical protein